MPRRAASTQLPAGEHSIDRVTPRPTETGWVADWSIRLHDGRLLTRRTQAPSKGELRRRAKATAQELLVSGGGSWRPTSEMTKYIALVSRPAMERADLRDKSRAQYRRVLALIAGECAVHRHRDSLKGHTVASGTKFRVLENCLREIARLHGSESARQARSVMSKYVLKQLVRDQLLPSSPLQGMSIDLSSSLRSDAPRRGGQALSRAEYLSVVDRLLSLDPAAGQVKPSRGRWSLEDRVAKRRNVIDLTLLQATTGLRISEANGLTWAEVEMSEDCWTHVRVTPEVSKTKRARRVPVLDERVAQRLQERHDAAGGLGYVIGSPSDPTKPWDRDNARKAVADLYVELARSESVELLMTARSHVWRVTLNTLLLDTVPEVIRAAHFGHDEAVNRTAYTDLTDTGAMVAAARLLRSASTV